MTNLDWTAVSQLLDPKLLIVLASCWVLRHILKQTPHVANWSIVYIVTGFALLFAVWFLGFTALSLLQGFLCGSVSVYGYQLTSNTELSANDTSSKRKRRIASPAYDQLAGSLLRLEIRQGPVIKVPKGCNRAEDIGNLSAILLHESEMDYVIIIYTGESLAGFKRQSVWNWRS